jgi:acyl carrier protein
MTQQTFSFEDLKRILVERAGLEEEDVVEDPEATFDDMGLDSLSFIEIQMAMQEEYGINVPEEDADQITAVGQAIDYVNRRLAEQS